MSVLEDALTRIPNQQDMVLNLLKKRGTFGAHNYELAKFAMSYQRRIFELVEMGHDIRVSHEGAGDVVYTYVGDLPESQKNRTPAADLVQQEINENYGGKINALDLLDILEKVGANVSRKGVAVVSKHTN